MKLIKGRLWSRAGPQGNTDRHALRPADGRRGQTAERKPSSCALGRVFIVWLGHNGQHRRLACQFFDLRATHMFYHESSRLRRYPGSDGSFFEEGPSRQFPRLGPFSASCGFHLFAVSQAATFCLQPNRERPLDQRHRRTEFGAVRCRGSLGWAAIARRLPIAHPIDRLMRGGGGVWPWP
jgi:hypothetical protein